MIPKFVSAGRRIDRYSQIEQARQNARRVRFDDRRWLTERESGNGVCGIFSNAWQTPHFLNGLWKSIHMSVYDKFCTRMEIPSPRVVAEALPGVQDFGFGSACQRNKIRKATQPLFVVRRNGCHLRLLEHEFRNENRVRVAGSAPGKVAPSL